MFWFLLLFFMKEGWKMEYIAHIREKDKHIQTVEEHLIGVRDLAESYGQKIGVKHIAGLAGMLHDLGKYTKEFKDYILEAVNNPESPPKKGSVDHSTAGGKMLYELFHTENIKRDTGILSEVVGNAIISHHSYLQDFLSPELESNYLNRVKDKELPEFENAKIAFYSNVMSEQNFHEYVSEAARELEVFLSESSTEDLEKNLMFLTKYIFSALVDADRTNTRIFEENKPENEVLNSKELFKSYYEKLMRKIKSFQAVQGSPSPINVLRNEMSEQCDKFAEMPSGVYSLSIPTGGGKTLASLRYGLKHAILHQKKRIIYVVPYTTIIEQNAKEIRKILEDNENILEHHSNVFDDMDDNDEKSDGIMNVQQKLKLAKDNWDAPIIITTMVQYLNVFFAKGSRSARRLHNLSESVVIFDEVQKVPTACVSLFNQSVNFLRKYGHSSMLLCTATQPALDFVEHKLKINSDSEIISNLDGVIQAFKRVEIIDRATKELFDNDKLAQFIFEKLDEVKSVLVILNTKSVVRDLYNLLLEKRDEKELLIYHLSTSMCAAHRNNILDEVRQLLSDGQKVICVSTQLIEAGVDVSFDCVVRSLAGLDSIAQAAGRCNRHGEQLIQNVYVIDHEGENLKHLKEIAEGKNISRKILIDINKNKENHGGNILSKQAMDRYFKEFYTAFEADLNYFIPKYKKDMTLLLGARKSENSYYHAYSQNKKERLPLFLVNSYKTAADHFQVISNITKTVLVPYGNAGEDIIAELNSSTSIEEFSRLMRKAQQYSINLYDYELKKLNETGGLVPLLNGKIFALRESAYSDEFGLNLVNDSQFETRIF